MWKDLLNIKSHTALNLDAGISIFILVEDLTDTKKQTEDNVVGWAVHPLKTIEAVAQFFEELKEHRKV